MGTNIQQQRANAVLNKKMNYPGYGVLTRLEWLNRMKADGSWKAEHRSVRNYAAEDKLEQWLHDHRDDNSANPNWPPTKYWLEQREKAQAGIYKDEYVLSDSDSCYVITKIEFDYFNSL